MSRVTDVVIVTGGLGSVGSYACRSLIRTGYRPLIVDTGGDRRLVKDVEGSCLFAATSVLDLPALLAIAEEHHPVAIVHLASLVGPVVENNPWMALEVNLKGTATVLECARLASISRLIYASSKMVYGPIGHVHRHPTYEPVREEHPREPVNLYGKLKRAAEDLISHYSNRYAMDTILLRFGSLIGPGKFGQHSGVSPVASLVEAAMTGRIVDQINGGEERDHFCYTGDFANGIVQAVRRERRAGSCEVYHIASEGMPSLEEIASILSGLYPGWFTPIGPGLDYRQKGAGYYFRLSLEKAARDLDFRPNFNFSSAVRDYHETAQRLGLIQTD